MSSSRLPNKVLLDIEGKPMLYYVIRQTRASRHIKDVIIATTSSSEDDAIVNYCKKNNLNYFRGSKEDVLDRYYKCAKKFNCNQVVRITSDCPLIDPNIIDKIITKFLKNSYDYVANNLEKKKNNWENSTCNFPQGMTVEISTFKALEKAWVGAKKPSEREHVFPYIQFNPTLFKVSNVMKKKDLSYLRCTVDRIEDIKFAREIYKRMKNKKILHVADILEVVRKEPHLLKINNKFGFVEGYKISLKKDQKYSKNENAYDV